MKKRSIIKKIQVAILAMVLSISLLAACTDSTEKPADNKTAEDLGMKASDAPVSDAADEPSKTESPDDLSEEEDEADSSVSSREDVSGSTKWNTGSEVTVTQGNCDFHAFLSTDGKESWIYKVTSHKDGLKKLSFPAKVKDAPVTRIGYGEEFYDDEEDDWYYTIFSGRVEPWHDEYEKDENADSITTIEFPETLTRIEAGTFCGFKKLKKVEIPDGVKELVNYSFAACWELTEVKLPEELTTLKFDVFDKCKPDDKIKAISKLTIPLKSKNFKTKNGFLLSKDSKRLIWAAPAMTEVIIPEGVTKLEDEALFATKATKVVIPKSVCEIGYHALSGDSIEKIELEKENKVFKMDGNCIYNKSDKSLVAIVIKNGRAKISNKVEILGENVSVAGDYIERVDIPKSVNKVIGRWMFFEGFEGAQEVYFHGTKPPQVVCERLKSLITSIPIFNDVYVPKKAKKAYIRWVTDIEGLDLEWFALHTF